MSYRCKRVGCDKTAYWRNDLKCEKCDRDLAEANGVVQIYDYPPSFYDISHPSINSPIFPCENTNGFIGGNNKSNSLADIPNE